MNDKPALRRLALARRSALTPDARRERDIQIARRLQAAPEFQQAACALFYVSFGEEVDTHALIESCFGDKVVLVPRVDGDLLRIHEIASLEDLQPGAFGVLEPIPGHRETDLARAEVIIVPGAAFDLAGHRIGYGKGYYDRLLRDANALTIGLAYDRQVLERVPAEAHDVPLDMLVTNERLLDFRQGE